MVLEQELMKYHRKSGVDLGRVNIPDFARAFGAVGFELSDPSQFQTLFNKAMSIDKPVLIDVAIDYSDNFELFKSVDPSNGH
jgi:acetolactate synthase-1/2/3 large subunit